MTGTTISRRQALATGAAAAAWALPGRGVAQAQSAAPLPASLFFETPSFVQAALSASGAHAAVVVGSAEQRHALVIIDLATLKPTPVARLTEEVHSAHNTGRVYRETEWRVPVEELALAALIQVGGRVRAFTCGHTQVVVARLDGAEVCDLRWPAQAAAHHGA